MYFIYLLLLKTTFSNTHISKISYSIKRLPNNISQSHIKCITSLTVVCFLYLRPRRSWRTDICKGSCALVCVSVEHDDSPRMGAVRRVVLESQYLLEPCGTGRTRLTHISRVDLRCGWFSNVLIVKVLINIAIINVCYLLFLLQGKISRMVQQGIWSPVY